MIGNCTFGTGICTARPLAMLIKQVRPDNFGGKFSSTGATATNESTKAFIEEFTIEALKWMVAKTGFAITLLRHISNTNPFY